MESKVNKYTEVADPNYKIDLSNVSKIPKEFWKYVFIRGEQVEVYLVDGSFIRTFVYIDFIFGGHHYVDKQYSEMMPTGVIFIEKLLPYHERECTLIHEVDEYGHMHYDGWPYEKSHVAASKVEQEFRIRTYESKDSNNIIEKYHQHMFGDKS